MKPKIIDPSDISFSLSGPITLDQSKRNAAIKVFFEKNKAAEDSYETELIELVAGEGFVIKKVEGEEDKFSVFSSVSGFEVDLTGDANLDDALKDLGRKLIFDAAKKGDVDYLQACLDVGVSLSEKDTIHGGTPLHWAANKSKKEACEFLVSKGADIFAMDNEGWTALYRGNGEAKVFLNKKREEVCRHYYDEFSPSDDKRNEVLGAFYDQLPVDKASPKRQFSDRDGFEYLIKIDGANYSIVGLDDHGGEVADTAKWKIGYALNDLGKKQVIFDAVESGDKELVQACLDVGVSANQKFDNGFPILSEAAFLGNKEVCELLIASGADIFRMDAQGKTALFYAREDGDEETIKVLLAESAKKPNLPNLEGESQNAILKNFFGDDETETEKEIEGSEGAYLIKKDGENYSVSVFVKNRAVGAEFLVQKLEKKELSAAIGDLGRSLIFNAARSGNTELFKACLEAGASVDDADENGKNPLFHAQQDPANEEIVELILQRKKDPKTKEAKNSRDKFHELAALVRNAYLIDAEGENVQKVIDAFSKANPKLGIGGLQALDMITFMQDISIKADENGAPDLNKEPSEDNKKLLSGISIDGSNQPDGGGIKAFYQKLLIACLEDEHRFISDEDTDNIRKLIVDGAKDKAATHDIGYSALNSVDKDSVAGLYMRALFEELKEREGLNENLTYEDFSRKLGDVVKINSKLDEEGFEGDIEARKKELTDLNAAAEKDEAKIALKTKYLEALENRKEDQKYKDSLDQNNRALNALLGSGDEKAANKSLDRRGNRDLRSTLNMMRGEVEFTPANILKNRELEEQEAAIKLQSSFKGLLSRRIISDVKEEKKVKSDVIRFGKFKPEESLTDFNIEDKFDIKQEDFDKNYKEREIEEVKGEKICNGNTGLVVHKFTGLDGLRDFTDQVEEANKGEKTGLDKVSIALIKDMPTRRGGSKDSFCVAVLSDDGATKIFSEKFDEITDRSSKIYEKNIKFETERSAIEAAIAFLTEARNEKLPGRIFKDNGEKYSLSGTDSVPMETELAKVRGEFSNQIAGLRKCLRGSELNPDDSIEEQERKRRELTKRLREFYSTDEGKEFKKLLSKEEKLNFVDSKNIDLINDLIEGKSTEEMRNRARQHTSRQMQSEIAGRVKNSMRDNEYKFNLDVLEVAEAVAKYQNQSLTQYSNIADSSWLGNGRGRKGFEELLNEKMPSSAYEGISVFRPRGKDNIATVTFNGAYSGDDTMYLALPDSPQCYIRVSRCDKAGEVSVWRDGKKIKEYHEKGDVLIDTGVVFHRGDDGKYERNPIHLDALEGRFGKGVKEAALDFKVKAISVNEGQRLNSAMLYNGKEIALELKAKSSPFQEADSHKPEVVKPKNPDVLFELEGEEIRTKPVEELVLVIGDSNLIIGKNEESSRIVKVEDGNEVGFIDSSNLGISENFKKKLEELLSSKPEEDRQDFANKLFEDDQTNKEGFLKNIETREYKEAANLIAGSVPGICKARLENVDKKYAVINAGEEFSLVIPVVVVEGNAEPKFEFPEIQFLDGGKLKQMKIFHTNHELNTETKAQIIEKDDLKFVQKFLSADKMEGKTAKEFLQDDDNYQDLCKKIKAHCEAAKVTVALQEVLADGTHDHKSKYKSKGGPSSETFQHDSEGPKNINSVNKATSDFSTAFKSSALNKFLGRPTFLSNTKSTGGRGS